MPNLQLFIGLKFHNIQAYQRKYVLLIILSRLNLKSSSFFSFQGPAKKNKIIDEETNLCTAYHEAGHTLVAYYTKDSTPLHKVTIVPRGMSLGHVRWGVN